MAEIGATDYETYQEIMDELIKPINKTGLDADTLKRLYESKAVYLENLRVKCFYSMNKSDSSCFSWSDYQLILKAIAENKKQMNKIILSVFRECLIDKKAS